MWPICPFDVANKDDPRNHLSHVIGGCCQSCGVVKVIIKQCYFLYLQISQVSSKKFANKHCIPVSEYRLLVVIGVHGSSLSSTFIGDLKLGT